MESLRCDLRQAAQRSGYQICVVKSYVKDGSIKKKITFGCQRKRLYTVQHAVKMKNRAAEATTLSELPVLYSQDVKKTLLHRPSDKGSDRESP
jgi:hypothetical protein